MSSILTGIIRGIAGLSTIGGGIAYGTGLFNSSKPAQQENNKPKLQDESIALEKELNAIGAQWKALIQDMVNRTGIFLKSEMEKFCNEKTSPVPVEIMGSSTYKWDHKVEKAECIKRQETRQTGVKPFEYDQTILKYEMRATKKISEPKSPNLAE